MKLGIHFAIVGAIAFSSIPSTAFARTLSLEEKASELRGLAAIVQNQYGPIDYKAQKIKLNLKALVEAYIQKAEKLSNLEFYYLVNQFVGEFHDSHFGSRLNTNHVSSLGFDVDLVEGKVLIDSVDRRLLPIFAFPFQTGDEVVAIDGKPVAEVLTELGKYFGSGSELTHKRMAAFLVPQRPSALVPAPSGLATLKVLAAKAKEPQEVKIPWRQSGEPPEESMRTWDQPIAGGAANYFDLSTTSIFQDFPKAEKDYRCSGQTRILPPANSKLILAKPFVAYYYPTPKGNVGYLRIPHYSWGNDSQLRFRQYEWAINELEKNTVALVIDQDHNCGGSVAYLEQMVSLFADKPFKGLEFQFLATRNEYFTFKSWLSTDEKATMAGADLVQVLDVIKKAWQGGDKLTPKTTFSSTRLLQPNSIRYTKPVLMLIDELSGSGGDAFPAMLQGLGRAKLMGTRTMGAGGHVIALAPLNYSGNSVRMTKSLFYHPNGTAIENNGATPDLPYTITREDFVGGYQKYLKTYTEAVLKLVP